MVSIRESGKEARRHAILAAAEALIRRSGSTDFSMRELAETAGLSLATTYNLIGSKSTVLYCLLNLRADSLSDAPMLMHRASDPLRAIADGARLAVRQFTSDPEFYRPLMRFLLGVPDPIHRPAFMARGIAYWRSVMQPLEETGLLPVDVRANDLANLVHLVFTGALDMWIHEEFDEAMFQSELDKCLAFLMRSVSGIKGPVPASSGEASERRGLGGS